MIHHCLSSAQLECAAQPSYGPIVLGDLVLLGTIQTHVSFLATAVTRVHDFVLRKACLTSLRSLILVILWSSFSFLVL